VTAVADTNMYSGTTSSAGLPSITSGNLLSGDTGILRQSFADKNVPRVSAGRQDRASHTSNMLEISLLSFYDQFDSVIVRKMTPITPRLPHDLRNLKCLQTDNRHITMRNYKMAIRMNVAFKFGALLTSSE
jgi:hypothetical protein